jgi:hypothetical protein
LHCCYRFLHCCYRFLHCCLGLNALKPSNHSRVIFLCILLYILKNACKHFGKISDFFVLHYFSLSPSCVSFNRIFRRHSLDLRVEYTNIRGLFYASREIIFLKTWQIEHAKAVLYVCLEEPLGEPLDDRGTCEIPFRLLLSTITNYM